MTSQSTRVAGAAAAYFAIVFAAGFALGTLRVLALAPRWGELSAVLIEVPFMLAIAWVACGKVLTRFRIPRRIPLRLGVGALAFTFLMVAEVILSVAVFDRSASDYLDQLTAPHGLAGLVGQLLFGLMPLARRV